MPLTSSGYYHGSKINNLNKLDISYSSNDLPFGPAVYLTKEKIVANCYSRSDGSIYCVSLTGNLKYTINLNKNFEDQTTEVKSILNKLFPHVNTNDDLRELIHPFAADLKDMNNLLKTNQIWMIYGGLGSGASGLMDRGIQYAVLNDSYITIDGTTTYYT